MCVEENDARKRRQEGAGGGGCTSQDEFDTCLIPFVEVAWVEKPARRSGFLDASAADQGSMWSVMCRRALTVSRSDNGMPKCGLLDARMPKTRRR